MDLLHPRRPPRIHHPGPVRRQPRPAGRQRRRARPGPGRRAAPRRTRAAAGHHHLRDLRAAHDRPLPPAPPQLLPTYVCQRDNTPRPPDLPGRPRRRARPADRAAAHRHPHPAGRRAALTVQPNSSTAPTKPSAARRAVERARYHAELARRRYLAVDPANRLVADTLEADWNTALRALSQAQDTCDQARKNHAGQLTDTQKTRIRQLVTDLPAIWNDPATPPANASASPGCCSPTSPSPGPATPSPPHPAARRPDLHPHPAHPAHRRPAPQNPRRRRRRHRRAPRPPHPHRDRRHPQHPRPDQRRRPPLPPAHHPQHPRRVRAAQPRAAARDAGLLTLTEMAAASACPPKPSKPGTTPGSSPGTPSTTKANASTRLPAPTANPGTRTQTQRTPHPTPLTTRELPGDVRPHRYHHHQDNNTTPRINPKRCSMQPEV